MKIAIGVSTYGIPLPNAQDRVQGFLSSYHNNIETNTHDVKLMCVDDGTPDPGVVAQRRQVCTKWKCDYLQHDRNRGIPAAWNTLVDTANSWGADVVFIFNDDIRFVSPGWFTRMVEFFAMNEDVGGVGFPLVNEPGFKDNDPRWGTRPAIVGAAVGCSFAVRPKDILAVENPDGSRGFWADLVSFHEEVHAGFRMAQLKKYSLMLPWPPVYHMGGRTFHASPELTWRDPSPYLPMEQFVEYARNSRFYIPQYEDMYAQGKADRMMYSRAMFCKYWGIFDLPNRTMEIRGELVDTWNEPQKYVHDLVVPLTINKEITWINKAGAKETCTV